MIRSGHSVQVTPAYQLLSPGQLQDIHDASMEILAGTGVRIHNDEAISLLRAAGSFVEDGNLVKIPAHLIDWAVGVAPKNVAVYKRTGEVAMQLGRRRTYFGTGSDTLAVYDPYSGLRRPTVLADVANFARLVDALPNLDFAMTMGTATDLKWPEAELHHFRAMTTNTSKPLVYTAQSLDGARKMVSMAEAIAGGEEAFRQRPFAILYIEPISPLGFAAEPMEKLLFAAEKGIPCIFISGMLGGATGPVTLAGSLALANAESLAGILIAQLKREGTPVISGGGVLALDMAGATPAYGAPEFMLSNAGIVELAHFYGLPTWGYAGCSDAKLFDEQAAADAAQWILMMSLAGANLVHDVGYLESGRTSSYEQLVFSDEMIGKTRHLLKGIQVDDETLAVDVSSRVGPGCQFLTDEHTVRHFRDAWFPTLEDRRTYEAWQDSGSLTMRDRVNAKVRNLLETHQPAGLQPAAEAALDKSL
jgi:trimethylamine---corrinoid protein Co-methyltransferase